MDGATAMVRVWQVVRAIPHGATASYGEVARRAGLPRRARWVAVALKGSPRGAARAVASRDRRERAHCVSGGFAFAPEQARRLRAEGRTVERGRVVAAARGTRPGDLDEWLWKR